MGDHLAISGSLLQAPLNPLKTDVSLGPPGLSGGPGPLGPHRNSTTAGGSCVVGVDIPSRRLSLSQLLMTIDWQKKWVNTFAFIWLCFVIWSKQHYCTWSQYP